MEINDAYAAWHAACEITRKGYRFDFPGDSGSTVYFCLRYENEKGGKEGEGPFGPILRAIIP
jgi:hypothetical protein